MATIRAFRALRPAPEHAAETASVPYDVVNTEEARALAEGKPHSFLRIIRSEVEFPPETSPYADEVYDKARENFLGQIDQGIFVQDDTPGVFLYRIKMGAHTQIGLVACSAVDDYDDGVIKLHEKTRPVKENDRTRHLLTIGAHAGPVFLAYKSEKSIDELVAAEISATPLYDVCAEDGVQHTIWRAKKSDAFCKAFAEISCTYVADGHHRAASASRARAEMKKSNAQHDGSEAYNFFLSVLFPHDHLQILPYNRIVKQSDQVVEKVLSSLAELYEVEPGASTTPGQKGEFRMYLAGVWYGLVPKEGTATSTDPVEALDVSLLQRSVLEPLFGIGDPRTDSNIDFIGGIRGTEELERLVDSGAAYCAFSVYHVSIDELFAIADAGMTMAPKSTWFEPKLRSGLLVHRFGEEA